MELFEDAVRYQDILSQTNKAMEHVEEIGQVARTIHGKANARKRALELANTNREKKLERGIKKHARREVSSSSSASTDGASVASDAGPRPDVQPDIATEVDAESSMNSDSD